MNQQLLLAGLLFACVEHLSIFRSAAPSVATVLTCRTSAMPNCCRHDPAHHQGLCQHLRQLEVARAAVKAVAATRLCGFPQPVAAGQALLVLMLMLRWLTVAVKHAAALLGRLQLRGGGRASWLAAGPD